MRCVISIVLVLGLMPQLSFAADATGSAASSVQAQASGASADTGSANAQQQSDASASTRSANAGGASGTDTAASSGSAQGGSQSASQSSAATEATSNATAANAANQQAAGTDAKAPAPVAKTESAQEVAEFAASLESLSTVAETDAGQSGLITTEQKAQDTTSFAGGTGAETDPYQIATAAQLAFLSTSVDGGQAYEGKYFILTDDIDLSGITWLPIGTSSSKYFKGFFDGRCHAVKNLSIAGSDYLGLFGRVSGGSVSNLSVAGSIVSSGSAVGGIVGGAYTSSLTNCISRVNITGTSSETGGLVGYTSGEGSFIKCGSEGSVSSTKNSITVMYGVAGLIGWAANSGTIDQCYSTGDVHGATPSTGGLAGYLTGTKTVSNCYATGNVTSAYNGSNTPGIGGLLGRVNANGIAVSNCYAGGTVTPSAAGFANTGGFVGDPYYTVSSESAAYTNNWCLAGTYKAFGAYNKDNVDVSYDVVGKGASAAADTMKSAAFATTLGSAFAAEAGAYPQLKWQDATATHSVSFTVGYDDTANKGADAPVITVYNTSGAVQAAASDGTYALVNGSYSYTISQTGYQDLSGTFTVSGENLALTPQLKAVAYTLTVTASPATAQLAVTVGGVACEPATKAAGENDSEIYTYAVHNGTYSIQASLFGYQTVTQQATVAYADAAATVALTKLPALATTFKVVPPEGLTFGSDDPSIAVNAYDTETSTAAQQVFVSTGRAQASTDLPAGNYQITVRAAGCATARQTFTVSAAGEVDVNLTAQSAWTGGVDTSWYDAASTSFIIRTPDELAGLAQLVNAGNSFSGVTFTLAGDLNLGNAAWTRIGIFRNTGATPFSGTFNGAGHIISGLSIAATAPPQGLFGYVSGSTVQNLTVGGAVSCTNTPVFGVAGIVGRADSSLIENCTNEVSVTALSYAGGIVGRCSGTTVRACTNRGTITATSQYVGGIAGYAEVESDIDGCTNMAAVSSTGSSGYPVGGIVGQAASGTLVHACGNTAQVTGTTGVSTVSGVGGITGSMSSYAPYSKKETTVSGCYNTGQVGGAITCAGGIVGAAGSATSPMTMATLIQDCYNKGNVVTTLSADSNAGQNAAGIVGVAGSMARVHNCYNVGSVSADWFTGYKAGIIGNTMLADIASTAYVSNNYTSGTGAFALGSSTGTPTDVAGIGETKEESAMKTSDFAQALGGSYNITSDSTASYYNDGYPYLLWQDPNASFKVDFTITLSNSANDDGSAAALTVADGNGQQMSPDEADGTAFHLKNGTYTYTVTKKGYETATGTITVNNGTVDKAVQLAVTHYTLTVHAAPHDASITVKKGDTVISPESYDEVTGTTVYDVLNGSYTVTARKYGYQTYQAPAAIDYGSQTVDCTLDKKATSTVTFNLSTKSESEFNQVGPVLLLFDKETGNLVFNSQTAPDYMGNVHTIIAATLPQGTYTYQVQAGGFDSQTGTVELSGDTSQSIVFSPHAKWGGANDVNTAFYNTSLSTFYVANPAELAGVARLVNKGTTDFSGKTVKLLGDMNLDNQTWTSIGYYGSGGKYFSGTFDGNGFAVEQLYENVGASEGVGFIGYATGATIENTTVRGSITAATSNNQVMYAGGLVGYAGSSTKIADCGNEVNLDITNTYSGYGALDIGGIAGWITNSNITGCYNTGAITAKSSYMCYAGGLVGYNSYTSGGYTVLNCYNTAPITITDAPHMAKAGGLIGVQGSVSDIENAYDSGAVAATSSAGTATAGALVGSLSNSTSNVVKNTYWLQGSAAAAVGENGSGTFVTPVRISAADMASAAFVASLGSAYVANNNAGGYPLLSWQDAVSSVQLNTNPDKTSYNDRENFDSTGMSLTVNYGSGAQRQVKSGWLVVNGQCLKPGQTSVTIDYHGALVTVPITVTQVNHTVTDSLALNLTAPAVGAAPQTAIDTGSSQYDATVMWTRGGSAVTGPFQAEAYYRAQITLTSHYVDGDAWWLFSADAVPSVKGVYETLYRDNSSDGRTITLTVTYPPTSSASSGLSPKASHLYYQGDEYAASYDSCLNSTLGISVAGKTVTYTVADIENSVLASNVGQSTTYSFYDGAIKQQKLTGVGLFGLLQRAGLPANAADSTPVIITGSDGDHTLTVGQLRQTASVFDTSGNQSGQVPSLLAFAADDSPLRARTGILTGQGGPLMAAFGMDGATDAASQIKNVSSIMVPTVTTAATYSMSFNVTCNGQPVDGYSVDLKDGYGNAVAGTAPSFTVNDSDIYSYTVSKKGYTTSMGTAEVDGANVSVEVALSPAWDGTTRTEPAKDADGYYLIGTPAQLMWWNANGTSTDNVKLTADIAIGDTVNYDATTPQWTNRFGDKEANAYAGTFDGQGHTISGLYINRENTIDLWIDSLGAVEMLSHRDVGIGLFGYARNATIKDLGVVGKVHVLDRADSMYADYLQVGGIVGMSMGSTAISGCYANVACVAEQATGGGTVGGYSFDGWPGKCDTYVGGIVGSIGGSSTVTDCHSRGVLIGSGTRSISIGGVAGALRSLKGHTDSITNCYSTCTEQAYPLITADTFDSHLGGIVGNSNTFGTASSLVYTGPLSGNVDNNLQSDAGTALVKSSFALNAQLTSTSDAASRTFANRIAGNANGTFDNDYAYSNMAIRNASVDAASSAAGTDISLARARMGSAYTSVGWSTATWQTELGDLPLLWYQNSKTMAPTMTTDFTPSSGDPGESDGNFGAGAPPTKFTVKVMVTGHDAIDYKTYTSTQMKALAAKDSTDVLKYSSYSYAGAAGRVASEYIKVPTLLSDAGLTFGSGDALVMGGTYDYDTYFGTKRYYFPNWDTGSSEGATEVQPAIVLRSYGTSSGCSDAWMNMYAGQTDYLWAYVLNFGQTDWTDTTYGSFIYQQTSATLRYSTTGKAEACFNDMLQSQIESASADLVAIGQAENAVDVPEGQKFVTPAAAKAMQDAISAAQAVHANPSATNDAVMSAIEAIQAAHKTFTAAIQTGEKPVDHSGLQADIAIAQSDLAATIEAESGQGVPQDKYWANSAAFAAIQTALNEANGLVDDRYLSQSECDSAAQALLDAIQAFEDARQPGTQNIDASTLQAAIDAAQADAKATATSQDGTDVLPANKWVTPDAADALAAAIAAAQKVAGNTTSTYAQFEAAQQALSNAQAAFDAAKKPGTKPIASSDLLNLVSAATTDKATASPSADGSNINPTDTWVPTAAYNKLADAIAAGWKIATDAAATQAQRDASAAAIVSAQQDFDAAKAAGTKKAAAAWTRLWGSGALDTMAAITKAGFADGSCTTAIVVTADNYPDALSASALAGVKSCPVLMTSGGTLSPQTQSELQRLGVKTVYLVGGEGALSKSVASSLSGMGITVADRLWGESADDTAVAVYKAGAGSWGDCAFVATSGGFADALSASPCAYAKAAPIFLTRQDGTLSQSTLDAIQQGGFKVQIAGGAAVVQTSVEQQLGSRFNGRLAGADYDATSQAIAEWEISQMGMKADKMAAATGAGFADALAGSCLCGKNGSVLVLADAGKYACIDGVVTAHASDISTGYIFGGVGAFPQDVADKLVAATE